MGLFLAMAAGGAAQTRERVYLQADRVDSRDQKVVASGHVRLEVAGIRLHCEFLEYNTETGQIAARGDCIFYWQDSFLACDRLDFNTRSRTGQMLKVAGQGRDFLIDNRALESDIFFWAERVDWSESRIELHESLVTTCNLPPGREHFSIDAELIEIIPRERLVASDVGLNIGDTTVYYVPTVNLSLTSDTPQRVQSFLPLVGHNGVDGLFVRNSFDYTIGDRDYGQILLDVYQNSGIGRGLKHHYSLGTVGYGDVYYYQVRGEQSARQRFQIATTTVLRPDDDSELRLAYRDNRFELPGFVSPVNENAQIAFTRRSGAHDLQVLGNFNRLGENQNLMYRLFYNLQLSPELSTRWTADYYSSVTAVKTAARWHYQGSLNHVGALFDSELAVEGAGGNTTYFLSRQPELSLRSKPFYLGPVPLTVHTAFGNLEEAPSFFRTTRADVRIAVPDQTVELGSARIVAGGGFRQLAYGSGDAQYVLAARGSYLQNLGSNFMTRIDYNYQDPKGFTPFQHDLQFPYHTLTGGMQVYDGELWSLSALAGYDLNFERFHDLMPRLDIRPAEGFQVTAASNYDPNFNIWRSVDSQVRFKVTDNFSVAHWSLYDLINERLTYQDFQVNYEHHDWIASVTYRGVQNEVYLQFSLKAFPLQQPGVGPRTDRPILPAGPEPYLR